MPQHHGSQLQRMLSRTDLSAAGLSAGSCFEPLEVTDGMQLLSGYTVSSRHLADPIAISKHDAIRSLASMPPGTILLPANHSLPPGSVLVPRLSPPSERPSGLHAQQKRNVRDRSAAVALPAGYTQRKASAVDKAVDCRLGNVDKALDSSLSITEQLGHGGSSVTTELQKSVPAVVQQPADAAQRSMCSTRPAVQGGALGKLAHKQQQKSSLGFCDVRQCDDVGSMSLSEGLSTQGVQLPHLDVIQQRDSCCDRPVSKLCFGIS